MSPHFCWLQNSESGNDVDGWRLTMMMTACRDVGLKFQLAQNRPLMTSNIRWETIRRSIDVASQRAPIKTLSSRPSPSPNVVGNSITPTSLTPTVSSLALPGRAPSTWSAISGAKEFPRKTKEMARVTPIYSRVRINSSPVEEELSQHIAT